MLAWALIATGIVGWMALQPTGPSQNEIWNANGRAIAILTRNFFHVASDTERYLASLDGNWTWDALNWTFASWYVASGAAAAAGSFGSGDSLGLNTTAMCVAAYGYEYTVFVEAHAGHNYPTILQAAAAQRDVYQNLSARLANMLDMWGDGEDPLGAIGTANVTAIRVLTSTLWSSNLATGLGFGPSVSQSCGI